MQMVCFGRCWKGEGAGRVGLYSVPEPFWEGARVDGIVVATMQTFCVLYQYKDVCVINPGAGPDLILN